MSGFEYNVEKEYCNYGVEERRGMFCWVGSCDFDWPCCFLPDLPTEFGWHYCPGCGKPINATINIDEVSLT